jgi:hypothetical protein
MQIAPQRPARSARRCSGGQKAQHAGKPGILLHNCRPAARLRRQELHTTSVVPPLRVG